MIIGLAVGVIVGLICQYMINKFALKSKCERIISDARKEAEVIKKNKLLEPPGGFPHPGEISCGSLLHGLVAFSPLHHVSYSNNSTRKATFC